MKAIRHPCFICILATVLIVGQACSKSDTDAVFVTVKKDSFEVLIPGKGELKAEKSTPIVIPPQISGSQTIVWIAAENSQVRKDAPVARLDSVYLNESIQKEENQIARLNLEIHKKELQLEKEKRDLHGQVKLTEIERQMADNYAARDETIFPKNKIIDDAVDLAFQATKEKHLTEKKIRMEKKIVAEMQLLQAKIFTSQTKIAQYRESLQSLEIKAPHDGLWVLEKTWNGEKYHEGMRVWAGVKLGTLPDLSRFEAKIFVLESEASGLNENLQAVVRLDIHPDLVFDGKVTTIDTIAKAIDTDSSLKYFETRIILNKMDLQLMRPGIQVNATIFAQKMTDVISVPNQALNYQNEQAFLLVKTGKKTEKRAVKTGPRSLTRTIITQGVREGERVLLNPPPVNSGSTKS